MNAPEPPAHTGTERPRASLSQKGWARSQVCGDTKYSQAETEGFCGSSRPGLGLAAPCLVLPQPRTGWAQLVRSPREPGLTALSMAVVQRFPAGAPPGVSAPGVSGSCHALPKSLNLTPGSPNRLVRGDCPGEPSVRAQLTVEARPTSPQARRLVLGPRRGRRPAGHVYKDTCKAITEALPATMPQWSLPDTGCQGYSVDTRRGLLADWCGSPTTYHYKQQVMEPCRGREGSWPPACLSGCGPSPRMGRGRCGMASPRGTLPHPGWAPAASFPVTWEEWSLGGRTFTCSGHISRRSPVSTTVFTIVVLGSSQHVTPGTIPQPWPAQWCFWPSTSWFQASGGKQACWFLGPPSPPGGLDTP